MRSRITVVAALTRHMRLATSLGVLATAACARADASATNDLEVTSVPVVAQTIAPSSRPWSTTSSGIVEAHTTVDVGFEVPGKVVMAGPDEGQPVRRGQEIAALDPTEYRLAAEQAAAQADRAARDRDRNLPLLASGSISAADMDHLESGARQSAAAAALANKRMADTRLAAPLTGIVARRAIEVGATVAPGQPVFTIVDLDPVRVRVGVPEADVGHITEGAAATVRVPALGASFQGRVSLIGVAADPSTRTYTVEVSVRNPELRLRAGMVAEAKISTGQTVAATMVPASAVLHDGGVGGTTFVYVLDRDGARVHARRVTTGITRGDSLEIASGVAVGEKIVVAGQQRLRDGARVRIQEANVVADNVAGGIER